MSRPALSASRAVAILSFLASNADQEFSLSDLASRLEINLASTHAVVTTLANGGYVIRHPRLRTYSLGPSVAALGSAALKRHPAIESAHLEAHRLSSSLGLSVAVTALAGDDIIFLERVGDYPARTMGAYVGQRIPLIPPIGAVFAAWQDSEAWLARAEDREAMTAVLKSVQRRGWAVALEGDARISSTLPSATQAKGSSADLLDELGRTDYRVVGALESDRNYDVVMVAAPVFDSSGGAVVALTLVDFPAILTVDRIAGYGEAVRNAGLVATQRSGGRAPSE